MERLLGNLQINKNLEIYFAWIIALPISILVFLIEALYRLFHLPMAVYDGVVKASDEMRKENN